MPEIEGDSERETVEPEESAAVELVTDDGSPDPSANEPNEPSSPPQGSHEPLIVGVGASAGGLEALSDFFAHLPAEVGVAVVVVTHQSPNRISLLPQLLAKRTPYTVVEAVDGTRVQADHVYIAPPTGNLRLLGGRLHVFPLADASSARHLPINHFFRSLAKDQSERAVGVVLSGTGSDGTLGLAEIKGSLGLSLVQAEFDAAFVGMPHSAITGDSPDFILPASGLPEKIIAYARNLRLSRAHRLTHEATERSAGALSEIFLLLRQRSGHDFSAYKETTVRRRIERRMNLHRCDSVTAYAGLLQSDPNEIDRLFDELLIGVTSFFRDPEAFEAFAQLFSARLARGTSDQPVRAWIAGCSTGEEAYSVAIVMFECMERLKIALPVQIFATDLDPKAIEVARAGIYPHAIAGDVDARRLERFFMRSEKTYQVKKQIRETLIFATQNLIEDPPFTKLDMMSCRNLLIYLDASLQRRLFPIFHYVLKPAGLLLLGSSETIGSFGNLFEPLDKKWRLYRRKEVIGGTYTAEIPAAVPPEALAADGARRSLRPRRVDVSLAQLPDKLLLRELVPPTVLMHERGDILHIHGRTGMFLEPAPGSQASANIYSMAREGLHLELAAAVRRAAEEEVEVLRPGVRVKSDGHTIMVDLRVKQLVEPEAFRNLFRVSFERARPEAPAAVEAEASDQGSLRVFELERELLYTKESHQGTIEELETANEELKSTNEELQSTNEELQSANEELETSKEELQSLNEELQTVNMELQTKVEELSRTNDDMTNLLNATDIATLFLDNDLNIKRYTDQTKRVIRLIPSDVGRPITDLVSRLQYANLVEDAREVLRTLLYKEVEVQGEGTHWYLMRILPYRTTDNKIDGLVVTFVDLTRVKLLQQSEQRLVKALQHSPMSVFMLDAQRQLSWAYGPAFGPDPGALLGRGLLQALGIERTDIVELVDEIVASGIPRRARVVGKQQGRPVLYDLYVEPHVNEAGRESSATFVVMQRIDTVEPT